MHARISLRLLTGSEQSCACHAVLSTVVRSRQPGGQIKQYIRAAALPSQQQTITKQAIALAASGAVLGPLCDGQHSKYGVLHYVNATMLNVPICNLQLETCWWVPLLFGFAAVILGVGHPALDDRTVHHGQFAPHYDVNPPWSVVMVGISAFVLQYAASGVLEVPLLYQAVAGVPALDTLLCGTAVLHWYAFDRSPQGMFMALLTAVAGPATEIFLINKLGLYHYNHATWVGIPTWIPWVYFCGSPAVGNLGRKVKAVLERNQTTDAS